MLHGEEIIIGNEQEVKSSGSGSPAKETVSAVYEKADFDANNSPSHTGTGEDGDQGSLSLTEAAELFAVVRIFKTSRWNFRNRSSTQFVFETPFEFQ